MDLEQPGPPPQRVTEPVLAAPPGPSRCEPRRPHLRRLGQIPELRDATGYLLDERPLAMSGVTVTDLRAALAGQRPLGFPSIAQWHAFQADLAATMAAAGIADASARLGGSSRSFFSSPWARRPFPQDLAELRAQVAAAPHNQGLGMDELEARLAEARERYIAAGFDAPDRPKPGKHFWDSRYQFHIDAQPADFDIEVASDAIDRTLRQAAARWRADHLGDTRGFYVDSGRWNQDFVIEILPQLRAFRERWAERLGRPVDFECFDGNERLRFEKRPDWWVITGLE